MKKIPSTVPDTAVFKDRAKEAEYWKKHFNQSWDSGTSVEVKFSRNLSETLNIRLDTETLNDVRSQARKKGLGPTQLIRMWIMEKVGGKHIQGASG